MEVRNEKTTVWVPREAFESVRRLWEPEFSWIPVPVDRSLPPSHIAFIQTTGPVSPLPPPPEQPKTPLSPLEPYAPVTSINTVPKTPRTPLGLPPLDTGSLRPEAPDYFGRSPELATATTAGLSPVDSDSPSTPSTATEPEGPSTPNENTSPGLLGPTLWRESQQQRINDASSQAAGNESLDFIPQPGPSKSSQLLLNNDASIPWKMPENTGDRWKTVDHSGYHPAHQGLKCAKWKRLDSKHNVKTSDHWQTGNKRDQAHWNRS